MTDHAQPSSYHLDLAKIARLDRVLADVAALQRHALIAGADTQSYVDDLVARRAALVSGLDGYPVLKDPARADGGTSRCP